MIDPSDHSRQPATPIIDLPGDRVALGPLSAGLLPLITRWDNDAATYDRGGGVPRPFAREAISAGYAPLLAGERDDWLGFAIYDLPDVRPIGIANLRDHGTMHRTAEFGITIGEAGCRGKGYGTEATRLILAYAFDELGVHNVWLDTMSTNLPALRAYTRAGFKEIGRWREAYRRGDVVADIVFMDCLASDFASALGNH